MVPVPLTMTSMNMPPTLAEVRAIVPPPTDDTDEVEVEELLWGPISPAVAWEAGSGFPASSILLKPSIDPELRAQVLAEVPPDVIPTCDDTVDSLVARLSASSFLEDSHVQMSGCLKRRVRLNAMLLLQVCERGDFVTRLQESSLPSIQPNWQHQYTSLP
jgi:hypothetical protein